MPLLPLDQTESVMADLTRPYNDFLGIRHAVCIKTLIIVINVPYDALNAPNSLVAGIVPKTLLGSL